MEPYCAETYSALRYPTLECYGIDGFATLGCLALDFGILKVLPEVRHAEHNSCVFHHPAQRLWIVQISVHDLGTRFLPS